MRKVVLAVLAASTVLMMAVAANAAAAQDSESSAANSVIAGVDARTSDVEITVLSTDYSTSASDIEVIESGESVSVSSVETARSADRLTEIVYVLDIDSRTMVDGALRSVAAEIVDSVNALPSDVEVALVTAGREAAIQTRLTTDRARFEVDLQAITADQGAALYDGIALAGEALSGDPGSVGSVILVSAGSDTASAGTIGAAKAALVQKGAQLVWISQGQPDSEIASIVDRSAGLNASSASVAANIASDRLLVTYTSAAETGDRTNATISLADEALSFSYPAGQLTTSTVQLEPTNSGLASDLGFFGQPIVLYVSILLAFAAISTALWSLGSMFAGGQSTLDKVLARYSDNDETLDEEDVQEMLIQTALIRRAVDMTETFAERRGFLARIEDLLERANIPVRAGEALFCLAAIVMVVMGLVFAASGSAFFALIFGLIAGKIGYSTVGFLAKRRLKHFEAQLPDALQLLAGTLRAGYSLPQGLDAVSTEIADPMGQELRRAITETQLGREMEDALAGIAERLDSADFAWAVMAIGIQREVGGNLAELLLTVSETMIQRERLHREVNALTAEGRVSAGILSLMPPVLGLVMWVMNPAYIEVLFSRRIGWAMLGAAVVSGLVGLVWMKKVITIDV
jgi:tight adherence protein B